MNQKTRIFIAGHKGMVGSATLRLLENLKYENIILQSKDQLNLIDQQATKLFYQQYRPEVVIICAAKVGGIKANMTYPADFFYENLQIQNNLIHYANEFGVDKVIFLGSSCIYPKNSPQPMKEEYLLDGKLEETNEGYALAKIAGLKMLEYYGRQKGQKFLNLMPCNLYGPNDSFDLEHSHVLSALIKKFTDASQSNSTSITLWGTGIAKREFMHVDDLARAILYFSNLPIDDPFINIGWGDDVSIKDLAVSIAKKVDYNGEIIWDDSKPNGMLLKRMDVSKMKEWGFSPLIDLDKGIDQMLNIYKNLK